MANRAYLLNTAVLTSDPYELESKLEEPGNDFSEVAEASYRIPIPWLCCFRKEDIRTVRIPLESWDGGEGGLADVGLPCTTVKQALLNLTRAAPLFEAIAGDAAMGRKYWLDALVGLRGLPLPYLTMNPLEVMFMDDPVPYGRSLVASLGSDWDCIPFLKELSGYADGVPPYEPDVLMVVANGKLHQGRVDNSVALDGGIGWENCFWHVSAGRQKADMPAGKPRPPGREIDLASIHAHIQALAKARVESAHISFGFVAPESSQRERLKLCVWTDTDAEQESLQKDRRFREELEGPVGAMLERVCAGQGFDWLGFVFQSTETVQRAAKPDYKSWLHLPPVPPLGAAP